jgi:hypothetical protein
MLLNIHFNMKNIRHPLDLFDAIFCVGNNDEKIQKIKSSLYKQGVETNIVEQKIQIKENKVNGIFVGQGVNQATLMIAKKIIEKNIKSALIIEENTKVEDCKNNLFLKKSIENIKETNWDVIRLSYNLCAHVEDKVIQDSHNYIKFPPRLKPGYIYGTNMWAMNNKAAVKLIKSFSKCWNKQGELIKSDESREPNYLSPNILGVWMSLNLENYLCMPMIGEPADVGGQKIYKDNYNRWKKEIWKSKKIIIPS